MTVQMMSNVYNGTITAIGDFGARTNLFKLGEGALTGAGAVAQAVGASNAFSMMGRLAGDLSSARAVYRLPQFLPTLQKLGNTSGIWDIAKTSFKLLGGAFQTLEWTVKQGYSSLSSFTQPLMKPFDWLATKGIDTGSAFRSITGVSKIFQTFFMTMSLVTDTNDLITAYQAGDSANQRRKMIAVAGDVMGISLTLFAGLIATPIRAPMMIASASTGLYEFYCREADSATQAS